jgi:hypothetical protein
MNEYPTIDCNNNKNKNNYDYENLKNKVFVTFDYSYYHIIPKTASMHIANRMNNLNTLIK